MESSALSSVFGAAFAPIAPAFYTALAAIVAKIICPAFLKRPFQDLSRPDRYRVENAVDFRIPTGESSQPRDDDEGEWLGAWMVRPLSSEVEPKVVILYLHGNCETRSSGHRVGLYHVFQVMGFPVLAVDYRGFGDSSGLFSPNETTLVQDAIHSYKWLKANVSPDTKVLVWGHSLGTGIATKMGSILSRESPDNVPDGYVLEAPFNSIMGAVMTHRIAHFIQWMGVDLSRVVQLTGIELRSAEWIADIREPVLIFHAEDDWDVSHELGVDLHEKARSSGKTNVFLHTFAGRLGLGHNDMYMDQQLQVKFLEFVTQTVITSK